MNVTKSVLMNINYGRAVNCNKANRAFANENTDKPAHSCNHALTLRILPVQNEGTTLIHELVDWFRSSWLFAYTEDPRYNDSVCYQRFCYKIEFAVIKKLSLDPSKA